MPASLSKTTRLLTIYHLFLTCQEVSFQEITLAVGEISRRTVIRDVRMLRQAGVLGARFDRSCQAYLPVSLEPFPMEEQACQPQQRYLEKIRRLCILMRRMQEEDSWNGMNKVELYREVLPDVPDRTRQRDFAELRKAGYDASYEPGYCGEPGRWYYTMP